MSLKKDTLSVCLDCKISSALWEAIQQRQQETGESLDHIVRAALADYLQVEHATLFQVSTAGALVEGLYQGEVSIGGLRDHGDFGLGTFEGLDGEMVVLDGHFYQVRADGTVREVGDEVRSPYAMVTRLQGQPNVLLPECDDLAALQAELDRHRDSQNVLYAIRVSGEFSTVVTRAVRPVPQGVRLVNAAAQQSEFEQSNLRGDLVGFWSPGYLPSVLVPGYHLHFLSEDRYFGGHLLQCSGSGLKAQVVRLADFRLALPESASFLSADFTRDPSQDLEQAERQTKEKKK